VKELIEYFVKNLEHKKHIYELLDRVKLVLTIGNERESCSIYIDNGMVSMSPIVMEKNPMKVIIQGNCEAISLLLNGRLKLREGTIRDELQVMGSFRNKLLLESVFYLGGKSRF